MSCEVGGVVYPDGTQMVPDPHSCNFCDCVDGVIDACTAAYCPTSCPEGTVPAVDCARCGPTDECEVMRYGCLPECDTADDCESGFCDPQVGACVDVCG